MPRFVVALLMLSFGASAPSWAASFALHDLGPGTGSVSLTEARGPDAFTAGGALQFDLDRAALGGAPVRVDFTLRWDNHGAGPFGGYISHGFSGTDLALPDYQRWQENSVTFGYAGLAASDAAFSVVWDFFGPGATVDWRLDYALAPVPLPAAGLLLASALGLRSLLRRRKRDAALT